MKTKTNKPFVCLNETVKKTNRKSTSFAFSTRLALNLIKGITIMLFSSTAFGQVLPNATSCTSNDLELFSATLPPNKGDAACSCDGTRTLMLSIKNKTGSERTAFAFWGTLERYNNFGDLISSVPISGCNGTIAKNTPGNDFTITTLPFGPPITISCNETLRITNLFLAWSTSNSKQDCNFLLANSATINPKCGTLPFIQVLSGVDGDIVGTNPTCSGGLGSIDLTPIGGKTPYSFAWTKTGDQSYSATTEDLSNLSAGTYNVVITDDNGCKKERSKVISIPSSVAVALTGQTNVLCYGASTGAVNITASGGVGPYTYAWTGSGVSATAEDQSGLAAGSYSVIVTDANGCSTASLPVTITQPATVVSVALTGQTNVLCYGASTGAVNITASGGVGPYTYAWTGSGVSASAEGQSGLAAGSYSVIVTDANGCSTASLPVTITQPATVVSVALTGQTNVLCYGASTGAVNITALGGVGPYTYAWTGSGVSASAEDQSGLAAGSYSVIVTDANGCSTASLPVTITQPATVVSVALTGQTNVLCYGASTGAVNITASGGVGPYTYAWTGSGVSAAAEDQSGLAAGSYSVIVTDANGCSTASLPVTITQPATVVSVALTGQTNVLCYGASTGAINITASGGVGPYTYAWTGSGVSASAEDQSGLAAGSYSVIVTDANGCSTASLPVTITQPAAVVSVALTGQTNVLCYGASTGAVNITASGGVGPYTYAWTGSGVSAAAEDQSGLAAGSYSVIVTDANGCSTASLPVTITQPAAVVSVALTGQTNVLCYGASTGAVNITASGGVGPYTYAWTGSGVSAAAEDQSGLAAGSYSVIVTDANGCSTASLPVTITQPAAVVSVALTGQTNVLCYGASTGAVNITASGGVGPYTYAWTGSGVSAAAEDQSGLAAGSYSVIVTDANGCSTASLPVTITQPLTTLAMGTCSKTDVTCFGGSDGSVTAGTVSKAVGNVSYSWKNSSNEEVGTTSTVSNLTAGTYGLTITDDCSTKTCSVTVGGPSGPLDAPSVTYNAPACEETTFSVTITGVENGATYTIKDKNGDDISGVSPGNSVEATNTDDIIFRNIPAGSGYQVTVQVGNCLSTADYCGSSSAGGTSRTTSETKEVLKSEPIEELVKSELSVKAYPNPFNNDVSFNVNVPEASQGSLELVNMLGQNVKTVFNGKIKAGVNTFKVNLPEQQTNMLIYVLRLGNKRITGKLIQIKR